MEDLTKLSKEEFLKLSNDKKIVLVVRKYYELTGITEDKKWVKYWKEKLLSSGNFDRCYFNEKSTYNMLFLFARDDKYSGKLVYPEGEPMSVGDIIGRCNLPKGGRKDIIEDAIYNLCYHYQMIFIEEVGAGGLAEPTIDLEATSKQPQSNLEATSKQPQCNENESKSFESQVVVAENAKADKSDSNKNKTKINNKDKDMVYASILTHWNNQNIITHRKLTDKMKRCINGRLDEGNTMDDILTAITNYGKVLKDSRVYWWTHKWTMIDFLNRGFDKFKDWDIVNHNYKRDNKDVKHNDFQENKRPDGYFDKGKRETAPATGENKEG